MLKNLTLSTVKGGFWTTFAVASLFVGTARAAPEPGQAGQAVVQRLLSQRFLVLGVIATLVVVGVAGALQPSFDVNVSALATPTTNTATPSLVSPAKGKSEVLHALEEGNFMGAFVVESCDDPLSQARQKGCTAVRFDGMKAITPSFFKSAPFKAARALVAEARKLLKVGFTYIDIAYDPYQTFAKDGNPASASTSWRHSQGRYTAEVLAATQSLLALTKNKDLANVVNFTKVDVDADRAITASIPGHDKILIVCSDTDFLLTLPLATNAPTFFVSSLRSLFRVDNLTKARRLALIYTLSFSDPMHRDDPARLCTSVAEMEAYFNSRYILIFLKNIL
jgi:hypothetical protein